MDDLSVAFNRGFKSSEVAEIRRLLTERRADIVGKWQEHQRQQQP